MTLKSKPPVFRRVGILLKENDKHSLRVLERLIPLLSSLKSRVTFYSEPQTLKALRKPVNIRALATESLVRKVDLLLVIGGDGTILRASRQLLSATAWKSTAILGINAGHTGFLNFLSPNDADGVLEGLLRYPKQGALEERSCLKVEIQSRLGRKTEFHALNDCVLTKGELSRLFEFHVEVDGEFLSSYRSDGLIVSTPTGSTAYNLAAGGAILQPEIPALQLTPICAQALSNKPIIVSDRKRIVLSLGRHSTKVYLTIDGHSGVQVTTGDRIVICKSPKSIRFLVPASVSRSHYFQSLRQKLKWGSSLALRSSS